MPENPWSVLGNPPLLSALQASLAHTGIHHLLLVIRVTVDGQFITLIARLYLQYDDVARVICMQQQAAVNHWNAATRSQLESH